VTSVDDVVRADEIASDGTLLHAGKKHVRRIVVEKDPKRHPKRVL
jgi:hypothetical protein